MSLFDYLDDGNEDKVALFSGVCPAVVTNIKDPDGLGRVKVRLLGLDIPDYETGFIRVCTPMTGNEFGALFQPEVGEEVLTAFCAGNLSRGYVIGSLRNKNTKPPAEITEENTLRIVRTKTGNEVQFDDTDGKEAIRVKTKKELTVTLEDEKSLICVKDKDGKNILKIDAENGIISLEADKRITMSAGSTKLTLDSNGSVSLTSDSSFKLHSSKLTLDGDACEIKTGGSFKVNSDGQGSIKCAVLKL